MRQDDAPPRQETTPEQGKPEGEGGDKSKLWLALLAGGGVAATVALLARNLSKVNAEKLDKDGPQLPREFGMSSLVLKAFVKGDWPLFIAYELERPGKVSLKIQVKEQPDFDFVFDGAQPGRHEQLIRLPASLGDQPQVATYSITATNADPSAPDGPAPMVIYALGAGDNAVGSSGFEFVDFQPGTVAVSQNGRATFTFRSKKDFSKATADFMLLARAPSGEIVANRVDQKKFNLGVKSGESRSGDWSCKVRRRASLGLHELYARGWRGSPEGADWMIASSAPQRVFVQ